MAPAAHSAIPISISQLPPGTAWWIYAIVIAGLALHIGGGTTAIVSGYTAVTVRKGGPLHVFSGKIFVGAMLIMAVFGTILSIPIHQPGNIGGGILAGYLVATGWMTVKRKAGMLGQFERIAALLPLGVSGLFLFWGIQATLNGGALYGYRSPLYYVFGFLAALFAFIDVRVMLRGGVSGVQRIARHLWRMCAGLFFAAGSFFLPAEGDAALDAWVANPLDSGARTLGAHDVLADPHPARKPSWQVVGSGLDSASAEKGEAEPPLRFCDLAAMPGRPDSD